MTQEGWYPDPSGQPQTYRYWDGSSWSEQTSGDPYAPPPSSSVPPPPIAPYQPAAPPTPPTPPTQLPAVGYPPSPAVGNVGHPRLLVLLVGGVVALFIMVTAAGFIVFASTDEDDATDRTTVSDAPTPETPTLPTTPGPSDPATTDGTDGTVTTRQQCLGGRPKPAVDPADDAKRVLSHGLSIPIPDGYAPETAYSEAFAFADAFVPLQRSIEQVGDYGWVSIYGVGGLPKTNGFTDPAQAAEVVMTCMAANPDLYNGFSGRTDLTAGEVTVDGRPGYQLTVELRVDEPRITVEGDVAQVVVVDAGDPESFGLYICVVPIGDDRLIAQQAAFLDRIKVE